jgi:hypothetical protein
MSKRSARKARHLAPFPCVGCGACCRRLGTLAPDSVHFQAGLTVDDDGACTELLPDGSCGIYDTRPNICRVQEVGRRVVGLPGAPATWGAYLQATADLCNRWIAEDGGGELVQLERR